MHSLTHTRTHIEDALEHILYVAADGTDTRHLFPCRKPYVDPDSLLSHSCEVQVNVFE